MTPPGRRRALPALLLAVLLLLVVPSASAVAGGGGEAAPAPPAGALASAEPSFGGCLEPPKLEPTIPADFVLPSQRDVNCFAWQQFIAVNWPADPATCDADPAAGPADFGTPADARPVVWQTYKRSSEVFLPGAAPPGPWCEPRTAPVPLTTFMEASPKGAWLTAQTRLVTLYEMLLNRDEFDYVVEHRLYDALAQQRIVLGEGLSLPDGSGGGVGAMEFKAAWVEIVDPLDPRDYLTMPATVTYPGEKPRVTTVGLVGLHVIHKTRLAQQFVWSTFEHVGNAPDRAGTPAPRAGPLPYLYFDPDCDPTTDYYGCDVNRAPLPGTDPYDAPMQVVRQHPIPATSANNVVGLNEAVWDLIRGANPDSVFLNYQLVNVQWPNANTQVPPGARVPLPQGDAQPVAEPVANTTMETYVQEASCLDCHDAAPISDGGPEVIQRLFVQSTPGDGDRPPYAADYSFLFSQAEAAGEPVAAGRDGSGRGAPVLGALLVGGLALWYLRRSRA